MHKTVRHNCGIVKLEVQRKAIVARDPDAALNAIRGVVEAGGNKPLPTAMAMAIEDPCEHPDKRGKQTRMHVNLIRVAATPISQRRDHDPVIPRANQTAVPVVSELSDRPGVIRYLNSDYLGAERNEPEDAHAYQIVARLPYRRTGRRQVLAPPGNLATACRQIASSA
ncbi:MAG: hypothetical protein HY881_01565 [Deltaproteobacteria bacterium]|nr:hypothetical protein [Deltaproteobacteria bacterium]